MSQHRDARFRDSAPWLLVASFVVIDALLLHEFRYSAPVAEAAPVKESPSLELAVEKQGDVLLIRWNPAMVPVQKATHGLLSVTDGDYERRIGLTNRDLKSGSVRYAPLSRNVSFQLALYDGTATGRGSVLFLARTEPGGLGQDKGARVEVQVRPRIMRSSEEAEEEEDDLSVRRRTEELPAEVSPLTISRPVGTPITPAPPTPAREQVRVAAVAPAPLETVPPSIPKPPSRISPPPAYRITHTMEPARETRLERVLSKVPFVKRIAKAPSIADLVKPVRRVDPQLGESAEMTEPLDARVEIRVDDSGNVKTARLVDSEEAPGNFNWAALRAARAWKFEAPKDGQTASLVLNFHLEPFKNVRGE